MFRLFVFAVFFGLTSGRNIFPVVVEELEGTIVYEKSAFVHFAFRMPNPPTGLLIAETVDCPSPDREPNFQCPLIHHIGNIAEQLRSMITTEQTQKKNESLLALLKHECGKIDQFLPSLYTDWNHLGSNGLSKCLGSISSTDEVNTDYATPIIGEYSESLYQFNGANRPPVDTEVYRMGSMIVEEVLDTLGFLHYFAEKTRWEDAVNRCKYQKVLPPSLVTTPMLVKKLTDFAALAKPQGYELAIPVDDASISAYWTLPTVDCTFSNHSEILNVFLGVPLKKESRDWSLHKLSVLPFHRQFNNVGYICYIKGVEEDEQYYKFDKGTNTSFRTDVDSSGGFLKYAPVPRPHFLKPKVQSSAACAATIISGATSDSDIVRNCQLNCAEQENIDDGGDGLFVQMISSDTFYIAKARGPTTNFTLNCGGNSNFTAQLPLDGAVEAKAGCGCRLGLKDTTLEVEMPCEVKNEVTFENVTLVHFADAFAKYIIYH